MATYFRGTNASLTVQWYEFTGGPPVDVSAQTVTITRISDATVVVGPTGVGIVQLATGLYSYQWAIPALETPGDYVVVWNATDAALDPVQTSEIVTIANTVAPCTWPIDPTACCPDWAGYSQEVKDRATRYATMILWAATGRRYGGCARVIRPWSLDRCCGFNPVWGFGGWMQPLLLDGVWRNCLCGTSSHECKPTCEVKLPGPVDQVIQVLVDGVVVDPDLWRVDDQQWLVRTDGECWPRCQNFDADPPAADTFEVTIVGEMPPQVLLDAAGTLACEFAKSCTADRSCRLPGRLQSITRQGVSANFTDIDALFARELTGLPEVDAVIIALNPYGHKQRPFFFSYDTSPRARQTTQA